MIIKELKSDFREFLGRIYIDSEYIDPLADIINKVSEKSSEPLSLPYGVFLNEEMVSFFTLDFSNPPVEFLAGDKGSCWLDSFFIAKEFQGKGLSKIILFQIICSLSKWQPAINRLNLTVNFKNHIAKTTYLNCGFADTGEIYSGGPAGPQHIYTITLKK